MNYVVDLRKGWVVHQDTDFTSALRYVRNSGEYQDETFLLIADSAKQRDMAISFYKEYRRLGYSEYMAAKETFRDIRKGYL